MSKSISISQEDVERAGYYLLAQLRDHGEFVYSSLLDDINEAIRLESELGITRGRLLFAFTAAMHHLTAADMIDIDEVFPLGETQGPIVVKKLVEQLPEWFEFRDAPNVVALTRST